MTTVEVNPINGSIGCAVIGYGLAGKTFHAPLIASTSALRLRTIVSSRADVVRKDWPEVAVAECFEDVLADPKIDLVVLATPDKVHGVQARAALAAGKHVVIDKPLAATLREAKAIARVAARSDKLCTVFQNRRWDSDFLTLKQLIADGAVGEIVQFESHYDRFRPTVVDRWKEKPGAGVWQDLGPHLIDQALQLFGMPLAIFADFAGQKDAAPVEDYFHVLLRYPRLRVVLHAGQIVHDPSLRYVVHGTRGSFTKHGLDVQESQSKSGMIPGSSSWGIDPLPGKLVQWIGDRQTRSAIEGVRGDYMSFYSGIADAIQTGSAPPVLLDEAMQVMRIIDAGRNSNATRREIQIE